MHPNVVVIPYYFNKETVRGVSYYQMLYTYVLSEAQQLPQNAVFQQVGAPLHITRTGRSLPDEMIPDSWNGRSNRLASNINRITPSGLIPVEILER